MGQHSNLTPKQQRFCLEYLVDLNATQAAIRAGYSEETANKQGPRMLVNAGIQEEIQRLGQKREKRTEITADLVLFELLRIARADISEAFDENGNLKPIKDIPEDVRRAISGVDVFEEFAGRGEDRESIGQTKKLRFWDKTRALEMLGRHLRLFADKLELTGKDGAPIQTETSLSPEQVAQVERIRGIRESRQQR